LKKHIISINDIPSLQMKVGHKSIRQDSIYEFIKKHPNCTRRDVYSLPYNEGDIRKSLISMLKSNKLQETFTIK